MHPRLTLFSAALALALAVGLGAFGAHALRNVLSEESLSVWRTAVQYHAWHALGLLGIGAWQLHADTPALRLAAALLLTGAGMFSGSLYGLASTGWHGLGILTPFGGVALIAGWLVVAKAALGINRG